MDKFNALKVLKNYSFRNLWLSQLISQTFLNVLIFSQLLHIYSITKSNTAVAILVLTVGLPNLLVGAFAGVLVDRWDKKLTMFCAQAIRFAAVILFMVSSQSPLGIYILMLAISTVTQFWAPAEVSTIPTIIKEKDLLSANSIFTLTFFVTVILGNIMAGPILGTFGPITTYLIISIAFLVATFFVIRLPGVDIKAWLKSVFSSRQYKLDVGDKNLVSGIKNEFIEGLSFIKSHKVISQAILYLAFSQTLIATLSGIAPGFADKVMGIRITDASLLILAPAAVGMVLGAAMVSQWGGRFQRSVLITSGLLIAGVAIICFSLVVPIAHFVHISAAMTGVIFLVILGFGNAMLDIPANTILQENSTEKIRSRIYGVLTALVGASAVLPVVVAGSLSDIIGVEKVMFGLGMVVFSLALYNRRR